MHLTVSDLDGAIAFYREVVGLQLAHVIAAREAALARGVRVNVISRDPWTHRLLIAWDIG